MPLIETKASVKIDTDAERSLKEAFGKHIELLPGKSERWLMLTFFDECRMAFAGDDKTPCAILEVKLLGSATEEAYALLTAALTDTVNRTLNIPKDRIYVKYEECETWGAGGVNF
jgi:phenylpyruvate tautomerase PptA (4-oxalocrotonate tautomerase family)